MNVLPLPNLERFARVVTAIGDPAFKCYAGAEALYHALGGKRAGYTPHVMKLPPDTQVRLSADFVPWPAVAAVLAGRATHWYLTVEVNGTRYVLDPTVAQFFETPEYDGKGCGFLTKKPSAAARAILRRAGL